MGRMTSGVRRAAALMGCVTTLALIGIFMACGGSHNKSCGSGDPGCSPPDPIPRFLEVRGTADSADCSCRLERGWVDDLDACMTEILPSIDDLSSCLGQVVATGAGVRANLECAIPAEQGLATCLRGSDCSGPEYDACFDAYRLTFADCPPITDLVFRELNACF